MAQFIELQGAFLAGATSHTLTIHTDCIRYVRPAPPDPRPDLTEWTERYQHMYTNGIDVEVAGAWTPHDPAVGHHRQGVWFRLSGRNFRFVRGSEEWILTDPADCAQGEVVFSRCLEQTINHLVASFPIRMREWEQRARDRAQRTHVYLQNNEKFHAEVDYDRFCTALAAPEAFVSLLPAPVP